MQNKRFRAADVVEKFGVEPEKLAEVLALMGDSVDNVPGVPGVGPKTAADLVNTYGDVEGVLASLDAIKRPKLKEALGVHAEAARLSRILVELKRDCELDPPLEGLKLRPEMEREALGAFLAKHGFRSLLAKLGQAAPLRAPEPEAEAPPALPFDRSKYECVTTPERLAEWIAEARAVGRVAFDTETTGLDATRAEMVGFSLATAPGRACYVPVAHVAGDGLLAEPVAQISRQTALPMLRELLEDPQVLKVGQNIKYDLIVMRRQASTSRPSTTRCC
jgi:DNA polymerase-1